MSGTSLALSPLIPLPLLLALGLLALSGIGLALWRRARGAVLRASGLALLLLTLLNPALIQEKREPIRDVAVIVVDQSPSQNLGERQARTEAAVTALQTRLSSFPDLEIRVVRSSSGVDAGAIEETRLLDVLNRSVSDLPRSRIAGAVLITDGQVHDVATALPGLVGFPPVHTLLTGRRDEGDRRLIVEDAPSYGIVGRSFTVLVKVEDLPNGNSREASIRIRQDGEDRPPLRVPVGTSIPVSFTVNHGGLNIVELDVAAGPEELTLANNRAAIVVNGVRDRLRVLLVSGEPHAGERTWRNLLKADPAVDLVHFTILRPPDKLDTTPIRELSLIAFPTRELFEVKLHEFDLIIFDRYKRRNVLPNSYLANIASYVENGGAFLEASGPTFASPMSLFRTPLGGVLPGEPTGEVLQQPFTPAVTALGRRHPVTAGLVPSAEGDRPATGAWGRWFRQIDVEAGRGSTVMSGANDRPLLILDRVGEGRVAQLTSDQIWLWSRGFEGGGPQAELLRRLAHWLMKEPELEENALRARVDGSRILVERRSLEPESRPLSVWSPTDAETTLELGPDVDGVQTGTVLATAPGIWRISDGEHTALAVVGAVNPPELADMRTSALPLEPVTQATGGGVWWLTDLPRAAPDIRRVGPDSVAAGRDWLGLRANGAFTVTGIERLPLLPGLLVLLLVLLFSYGAWYREGR